MKYGVVVILFIVLVSFTAGKKQHPVKPADQAPFGHVQSVREVTYYAKVDSAGNISKGDMEYFVDNPVNNNNNYNIIHRHDLPPKRNPRPRQFRSPIYPIAEWKYDVYGDETEHDLCRPDGSMVNKDSNIYYETGDVKEMRYYTIPSNSYYSHTYAYTYNQHRNIIIVDDMYNSSPNMGTHQLSRTAYFYDTNGRAVQVNYYCNNDTVNPVTITYKTYNERGELLDSDLTVPPHNPPFNYFASKDTYTYDAQGRLNDHARYGASGNLLKDVKTRYVATGTTREDEYNANGLFTGYIISHYSANHLKDKEEFQLSTRDTVMTMHTLIDSHFNCILYNYSPATQQSYKYTYDIKGNWITRIEFDNNKPVKFVERKIVYYKD